MLATLILVLSPSSAEEALPGARAHHWLVYDESRKGVVLCGGSTPLKDDKGDFVFYDDQWSFDGRAWNPLPSTGRRESGARVVFHPEGGGLVAFGGFTTHGRSLGDLREWVDGKWSVLDPAGDKAAAEPGFVYDTERQRFVLFGGTFGRGDHRGTTWEWDGTAWETFGGAGPSPRSTHGMVYDARRGRVVLFGGMGTVAYDQAALGDTWEWDGKSWREVPGPGPSARIAPGMAYDSKRGRTLLFGGGGGQASLGDTWSFDGTKWEELKVPGPSARTSPAMAYDPERDRMVLFGGRPSWPDDVADTWLFDGTAWTEATLR